MRKFILSLLAAFNLNCVAADIYVSPNGADTNDGTKGKPLQSLRIALRQARNLRRLNDPSIKDGITIHLLQGTYNLYETLYIRPEDSGTPDSPTLIKGDNGAVISGGVSIKGWKKQGKYLVADVPFFNGNPLNFRQLYINGHKAQWARDVNNFDDMSHILSLDKPKQIIYVPATPAIRALAKQFSSPRGGREGASGEMVLHEMWCVSNLRIKDIKVLGDSAAVTFLNPESTIQFEHPWPSPMVNTKPFTREDGKVLNLNSAFYLQGAKCLMDTPGEWYLDRIDNKVYYYPKNSQEEKLLTSSSPRGGREGAIVPALESVVQIEGTLERPVLNVHFEGISFEYTTWLRPSEYGHVPLQAGMYMLEGYKLRPQMVRPDRNHKLDNQGWLGRPSAAVTVRNASGVVFDKCLFEHCGASGLDYLDGTKDGIISNSEFRDIAGNAIVAGSFGDAALENHLPYNPSDPRVVCDGLIIANNSIHDVTTEDWGCLGICCGYVADCIIANNLIYDVSYSGINVGWGWTSSQNCMHGNEIYRNRIYHYARHMYDCAGIYTLSAQPKTFITENYVSDIYHPVYAHDPNHWFYLYCDEGSSFITVQDNWTPTEKYLKNANGPGCIWENNGPQVDDSVKTNAGIVKNLDLYTLKEKIQTRKPTKK